MKEIANMKILVCVNIEVLMCWIDTTFLTCTKNANALLLLCAA